MNPYKGAIHHKQDEADRSMNRIRQLVSEKYSIRAIADILNAENYRTIRGRDWTALNVRQVLFKLRHKIATWYALSARRAGFMPPSGLVLVDGRGMCS